MTLDRFQSITARYASLRVAVVGDFCLDRYLEIDPTKQETSIETNLPVHNVVHVRSQPGGAGTILNNLVALGIGSIHPVGFCGTDGEGFELQRALRAKGQCVQMNQFFATDARRTFTYCKPLLMHPGRPPEELNRLDSKNWTPTPGLVEGRVFGAVNELAASVDAFIVLDQVDTPGTGVVTARVLAAVGEAAKRFPLKWILADSRRGLRGWPPVCFKMNAAELGALAGLPADASLETVRATALALARQQGKPVFVTLSERGILAAAPDGTSAHAPALPARGPLDIVGAGDAVTANLAAALASGAIRQEALELAMAAASVVIHQIGTTGTATVALLAKTLFP
ncbi:MAG TPA: PfkB family carbohydrate kinase [Verrucomicrobiae bacterium]|nr:PfkB family carbohydrate kinase [Verrucomicrobiae bacterium]